MSSSLHVWRVDLRLQASRIFLLLIVLLHLAAMVAVMKTAFPFLWRLPLVALLLGACWLSLRQERKTTGFILREQAGSWWLETAGPQGYATLQRSQVWRYLVVMDFLCHRDSKTWRQRVVIFPDSVSADSFRRLRVRLRYGLRLQDADLS